MSKAVILVLDDDLQVLQALARDLRGKYGSLYRILRADAPAEALASLRELKGRGDSVALLISDQRMPKTSGVAFLNEATAYYPDAKRVLLTAYADTDAAISAINQSKIHYYLMKPWDPPEEKLYPVLDDLLDDWQANHLPEFTGIKVIGHRYSPLSHEIKDMLARNNVPYRWFDVESDPEATPLLAHSGNDNPQLPLVLFPDGARLERPTLPDVAEHAGLKTEAENAFYKLAIVGAGPAGLAAAVYGASEGLGVVLIDAAAPGGQAGTSSRIENYLGFPSGLSGGDLARRAVAQAKKFGAEIIAPSTVERLRIDPPYKIFTLQGGSEISAQALVISTGVSYRHLDVPGMDRLRGAGVYYGASVTEASACSQEDVYVVGAGNSAGQAAMYLSRYARSVHMLVRGSSLEAKMSQYLVDQIRQQSNICIHLDSEVSEVFGEEKLEAITIRHKDGSSDEAKTGALFVFIGATPHTDWLEGIIARDERGFIITGPDLKRLGKLKGWREARDPYLLETSVPGIFAAGDVRHSSVKRVASAVGEGSIAVQFIHQYLAALGGS